MREVVEHPGAVGIIALKDNGNIVMVRQYRKAVDQVLLELPAGNWRRRGPGRLRRKELAEETGYTAAELRFLVSFILPWFFR